ncbi:MAG: YihY/virulence factor BrkB family protein [Sandaracinus sp.]
MAQSRRSAAARDRARRALDVIAASYARHAQDNGDGMAASLAFGALLSVAPLLFVVLAIASSIVGEGPAHRELQRSIATTLGHHAVTLVDGWIAEAEASSGTATLVGFLVFIIGSARLVGFVDGAFRLIFEAPADPSRRALRYYVHDYVALQVKTLAVTLAAGLLMSLSLALGALVDHVLPPSESWLDVVRGLVREALSYGVWVLALAMVYWALPPIRLARRDVLVGALVTAALVEGTFLVVRAIADVVDVGAAYGAAGVIVGTLFAIYVVSQLFLFGAELTAELAARRGAALRSGLDGTPERVSPPHAHVEPASG